MDLPRTARLQSRRPEQLKRRHAESRQPAKEKRFLRHGSCYSCESIFVMRTYQNFIGGEWAGAKSGQSYRSVNPADTREVVAEYPASAKDDAVAAIDAAKKAYAGWAAMTPVARGRILSKASQILESRKWNSPKSSLARR